jgi:hypothetical protein
MDAVITSAKEKDFSRIKKSKTMDIRILKQDLDGIRGIIDTLIDRINDMDCDADMCLASARDYKNMLRDIEDGLTADYNFFATSQLK